MICKLNTQKYMKYIQMRSAIITQRAEYGKIKIQLKPNT